MQQRQAFNIDLPAQVTDVGLKHAGITTEVIAPHMVKQLDTREHPARIQHQITQQAKLGRGQFDLPASPTNLARLLI